MRKKKLEKMIIKEEETRRQIDYLLGYIETLKVEQKKEADTELLKAVHGKKFDPRDLLRIIKGIENDKIRIEDEEADEEAEENDSEGAGHSNDIEPGEQDLSDPEEDSASDGIPEEGDYSDTESGVNNEDEAESM